MRLLCLVVVAGFVATASASETLPFFTGFEAGEGPLGYVGGPPDPVNLTTCIDGQPGWGDTTRNWSKRYWNSYEPHVDTANPYTGGQHLRLSYDPNGAMGSQGGAWSPSMGVLPAGQYTMNVDVCIGATGGADYDIIPQQPSTGYLTTRIKNYWSDYDSDGFAGDVLVLDILLDPNGNPGLYWVDSGFDYPAGAYYNLDVAVDATGAGTITYTFDDHVNAPTVYVGAVFAGTAIEEVVFLEDNYNYGESGDFDNLSITPEPSTIALLALGGLALLRRR